MSIFDQKMASLDSSVEIVNISDGELTPGRSKPIDPNTFSPRPLLESVSARFEHNKREREERVQRMRSKQEIEKVHSRYLKNNVASRYELDRARPVVSAWAQRNGRQRAVLTERQRRVLMEIETVDGRNTPVRRRRMTGALNVSNNADDYNECCAVIGCGIKFTCHQAHRNHDTHFEHCPCNPLLNMLNGCLPDHPLGYVCPQCGESFQRGMDCQEHMVMSDHLSLFSPLAVCAYMCPQCLLFFSEKMRCHNHMEELHHYEPAYPFSDDLTSDPSACPRTIPVPTYLGMDFVLKVRDCHVQFSVSCVECGLNVTSQRELEQHRRETEESHIFTAATQGGLAEVFAEYLGDRTCSTCLQILKGPAPADDTHHCTTGMQGNLMDINCKSFSEFVRRSGLTLSRNTTESTASRRDLPVENGHVIVINSAPNSPAVGSLTHVSDVSSTMSSSSSSSGQRLSHESSGGKKRVHVTILSSSSEDESDETLTWSASKRRKVEKPERPVGLESTFSIKMQTLATDLSGSKESNEFKCGAKNVELDKEESDSMDFRNETVEADPVESDQCGVKQRKDKLLSTTFNTFKNSDLNSQPSGTLSIKHIEHVGGAQGSSQSSSSKTQPSVVNNVRVIPNPNEKLRSTAPQIASDFALPPLSMVRLPSQSNGSSILSSVPAAARRAGDPENLDGMRLIIFLDLDNWGGFFKKLPQCLPDKTFVWAFYGGKNLWKPPRYCITYQRLLDSGCLHFHEQCGSSKDAADFAICLTVGKMDERLPKHIPFTILSGDKGFLEVERQMKLSTRRTVVIDPHNVQEKSNDVLYAMIISVIHD